MSFEFYTMVKASPGFWEALLMKQFGDEKYARIDSIKEDEIIITKNHHNALDEIIRLSREYPDEVFRVKVTSENIDENYVILYECSGGKAKPIKEGYEYCFSIKVSDQDKLDKGVFDKFKKKVAAYYKRIGNIPLNDVHLDLTLDEVQIEETDANLSVTIEYKTPNARLTAKKHGITCVDIEVDFFDTKEKSLKQEIQSRTVYRDLPF